MSRAVRRFTRVNPPLPVIGTQPAVQLTITGTCEAAGIANVFNWTGPAGVVPTTAQLTTLLANIKLAMAVKYRACLTNDWAEASWLLSVLNPTNINTVQDTSTSLSPGTGGAGHLPTTTVATIIRHTATKGQHGRGRLGIGPMPSVAAVAGTSRITLAYGTILSTFTAAILPETDGVNTYTPSILQKSSSPPRLVIGSAPLINFFVSGVMGSARKRKINR